MTEYPPLLPGGGWRTMSMAELHAVCVDPFPSSTRRRLLWGKFELLTTRLRELRVPCVLWVDGSMLTQKQDPKDIDVVLEIDGDVFEALPGESRDFVDALIDKIRCDPDTDILFLATWPPGHPEHDNSDFLRSLYMVYCGWNADRTEERAIPRIDLSEVTP